MVNNKWHVEHMKVLINIEIQLCYFGINDILNKNQDWLL